MRKSALFWFGLVVTALVALGLVVLSSASEANAVRLHSDAYYFMKRQFMYLAAGLVVVTLVSLFDYHKWRDYEFLSWFFFAAVMVLLVAVFGFRAINGSHRWISLGPIRLQLLSRAGETQAFFRDAKDYFGHMAETTGTLWENDSSTTSCCHGFASYVTVLLDRHVKEVGK